MMGKGKGERERDLKNVLRSLDHPFSNFKVEGIITVSCLLIA